MSRLFSHVSEWPLSLVRFAILLSPLLIIVLTIGPSSLAAFTLVRLWAPQMAKAITPYPNPTISVTPDMLLLLLTGVKTMRVLLDHCPDASLDKYWLLPLELCALYTTLSHLVNNEEPHPTRIGYNHSWIVVLLCAVVGSHGYLLYLDLSLENIVFTLSECALGIFILLHVWNYYTTREEQAWVGGSIIVLQYLYLTVSTLLLDDAYVCMVHAGMAFAVGCLSVIALVDTLPPKRSHACYVARKAVAIVYAIVECVFLLASSVVPFEIAVLAANVVILHGSTQVWFTSHTTFPPKMAQLCYDGLYVIDHYIKLFYEFTSDPDFQSTLEVAMPEVAGIRSGMYRLINHAYSPLTQCHSGKIQNVQPSSSKLLVLTLVFGVVTACGVLVQVFPRANRLATSAWFWALSTLGAIIAFIACQLLSDAGVVFWYSAFRDAEYTRVYTPTGHVTLYAQIVLIVACLALFVHYASASVAQSVRVLEDKLHDYSVRSQLRRVGRRVAHACYEAYDYWTEPSILLFAATAVGLALIILSTGSPIRSISIERDTYKTPPWVYVTPTDRFLVGISSLEVMLLEDVDRPVLIGVMMIEYATRKFGCLACFCVPLSGVISGIETAVSSIESAAATVGLGTGGKTTSFFDNLVGGLDSTNSTNILDSLPSIPVEGPIGKIIADILASSNKLPDACPLDASGNSTQCDKAILPTCVKKPCSSSTDTQICVVEIINTLGLKLAGFVLQGIELASAFVATQLLGLIPNAKQLTDALKAISEAAHLIEFDVLKLPDFEFNLGFNASVFEVDIGIFPAFSHPMTSFTPSQYAILASCVAAVVFVFVACGLGSYVVRSAFLSLQLITLSSVVVAIGTFVVLEFELSVLLRGEGYSLVVVYGENLYLYAIAGASVVFCTCLRMSGR